jgi:NADH-ubiquinone oxidoreductase chain 5
VKTFYNIIKRFSLSRILLGGSLIFLRTRLIVGICGSLLSQELIVEWELISVGSGEIVITFILDFMSLMFLGLVRLIAGRVVLYSSSYMSGEVYFSRFQLVLIRFIGSIYLLILRPNTIRLLLGWDGLGVTSYLLVIFYQRPKSYNAGIITALTNRIGDVGLLVIVGISVSMGSWRYIYYSFETRVFRGGLIIILILSACTKRAQVPFSSWLPAAMAAPTPVSALVHSSTLVTAGVFLLIRFNVLLCNLRSRWFLCFGGALTIIIAGLSAINEIDIKKIIALSTLRQLGVIIITLGANIPLLSFFHLLSHAYFKAILFMCAGSIIHRISDYQDIRTMRLAMARSPLTLSVFFTANLRLSGLPFLRGFFSKDLVLEAITMMGPSLIIFFALFLGTLLTVAYSCRVTFLLVKGTLESRSQSFSYDRDIWIIRGTIILLPFRILSGYILNRILFRDLQTSFFPSWLKFFILTAILLGGFLRAYRFINQILSGSSVIKIFLSTMWFIPITFRPAASGMILPFSKRRWKVRDTSWVSLLSYAYLTRLNQSAGKPALVFGRGYRLNSTMLILPVLLLLIRV